MGTGSGGGRGSGLGLRPALSGLTDDDRMGCKVESSSTVMGEEDGHLEHRAKRHDLKELDVGVGQDRSL